MSTEIVGDAQYRLLMRARLNPSHSFVLEHNRASSAERLAARRLIERGLLTGPNAFGNARIGWVYMYGLTERGATCRLRTGSEGR